MSKPVNINETLTFNPTGTTGSTNISTSTSYPLSNGYNSISNTSNYARLQLSASSTSTDCYIYYTFNVSGIPENATITSVACTARIYRNSRVTQNTAGIQLYSNTTAKGSAQTGFSTTASNVSITNTGSWTVSELNNVRLRIIGRRSSTNQSSYIYFYGANLTIDYTVSGTNYEITSTLATNSVESIDPAGYTEVFQGDSYALSIFTSSIDDIIIEDNGVDVTDQLVLVHSTGDSSTDTFIPISYDESNSLYDSIYEGTTANGLSAHTDTSRICAYVEQTAYAEAKLTYNFNCSSIPANAIITNVSCIASAACYSNGQYFNTRTLQLYSGNTAKGSATTITGTGNTRTEHNIDGGSWTRNELNNAKIVVYIKRGNNTTQASFSFWGATLSVTYALPEDDYYIYTLNNVSADHIILISDAIIEIPEEDPQYNYYPVTISSINATTNPGRGTTRVVEGTNQTITIYPDDPLITLITDNGVDVSNQLVQHGGTIPTPTVATVSGASYGFTLNSGTGYYVSSNTGVDRSAALCRVSFNLPVRCLVTIQYINYAEATYDFGVFGNIDVPLSTSYYAAGSGGATITDSNYKLACNTSAYNTSSAQTITYEIASGQHYIDIKYSKDDGTSNNNDSLQWKILSIEALEPNNYYTYTLSNINTSHSLIFIFGDVTYYFVNSSGSGAKLFPSGSIVQLPGDSYRLTIVPDNYNYGITLIDNNIDRTANVERKEEEIEKDGNTITVVNYVYNLSNIQTTHNLIVTCISEASETIYLKINSNWESVTKVYKNTNNSWQEVSDFSDLFESGKVYIKI